MKTENIERYLESFGKQVVAQSKTTLNYKKGGDTKLENSIKFEVITTADGFTVQFYMSSYGQFLDKGVSGNKIKRSYKSWSGKTENSPGKGFTTKGPPVDILSKWIKKKGIKPKGFKRGRSKNTGQFISGFAYLISRKIKREGIKSLAFFQKPLGLGLKQFGKDLLGSVKEDILNTLKKETITQIK